MEDRDGDRDRCRQRADASSESARRPSR
jgi:hypothetical protein